MVARNPPAALRSMRVSPRRVYKPARVQPSGSSRCATRRSAPSRRAMYSSCFRQPYEKARARRPSVTKSTAYSRGKRPRERQSTRCACPTSRCPLEVPAQTPDGQTLCISRGNDEEARGRRETVPLRAIRNLPQDVRTVSGAGRESGTPRTGALQPPSGAAALPPATAANGTATSAGRAIRRRRIPPLRRRAGARSGPSRSDSDRGYEQPVFVPQSRHV